MKKQWKKMSGLAVLCAAASMSAQAAVTIDMGSGAGSVPGVGGNFSASAFSALMTNTTEASTYTVGTFSALPSGNPGSGVSFDVVAVASANVAAQPTALGVNGGSIGTAIDNNNNAGPLEWVSFAITNVTGLGAGDVLVITSAQMLFFGADESYRLDIGSAGSAPLSADVVGGGAVLAINSDAFTLGAGSVGNATTGTRFALGSITVDVVGEPGAPIFIDEHFTAAEGYVDGPLNGPWSGDLASFTVDSSGTGTVLLNETNIFDTVTHGTSLPTNDLYTIGMEFSFNRATNDITDNNNTLFELLLSDGSAAVGFGLSRVNGVGRGNRYKLKSNASSNLSPQQYANSGWFTEDLLGFTNATDSASDQLWMGATVTRGTTATNWTATFVISNLTQNAEVLAWDRTGSFYLNDTVPFSAQIALDEDSATLAVSNRVIDRVFASSIPDEVVVPGAPIFIDEHFTAAEGYVDGALNGPWSGDLASFTVDSSGTGTVLINETNSWKKVTHGTSLPTNDLYTIGMEFSFNRATNDITDNNNTLFELLLADGSGVVGFGLMRRNGTGVGNQYRLKSNASSNLSPQQYANSGTFTEDLLGFTNATDSASDQLWMGATVTRGTTATNWTATFVISNLTQNAEVLAWDRTGSFYLNDTVPFSAQIALDENSATLAVSNRVIDRVFASSIPLVLPDPYEVWASANGVGAMDEDEDEDGLNNLGEFALNGDPNDPNDQGLTAINTQGGTFEFVHAMLSDPASGVEYIVEVNDMGDLVHGGWTNAGITVTSGALDADYDLVTNSIPTSGTQNFIRLLINQQ